MTSAVRISVEVQDDEGFWHWVGITPLNAVQSYIIGTWLANVGAIVQGNGSADAVTSDDTWGLPDEELRELLTDPETRDHTMDAITNDGRVDIGDAICARFGREFWVELIAARMAEMGMDADEFREMSEAEQREFVLKQVGLMARPVESELLN